MSNGTLTLAPETVDAEIVDESPQRPPADAQRIIDALLSIAALIEKHPELVHGDGPLRHAFSNLYANVDTRADVAHLARLCVRSGAKVEKFQGNVYAGVEVHFTPPGTYPQVYVRASVDREQICERVVTGTHEVIEEVPDPDLLAAVPKVTNVRVEEIVEWKCRPILPDELPAGGGR